MTPQELASHIAWHLTGRDELGEDCNGYVSQAKVDETTGTTVLVPVENAESGMRYLFQIEVARVGTTWPS